MSSPASSFFPSDSQWREQVDYFPDDVSLWNLLPVTQMPMYLRNVAHVLPLLYLIDGLNQVMIFSNLGQPLFDLELMVVLSATVFVLAVIFFKWRRLTRFERAEGLEVGFSF